MKLVNRLSDCFGSLIRALTGDGARAHVIYCFTAALELLARLMTDLRVNQEMACSIRERHQKTKEVFALSVSLSTPSLPLSLSSPSLQERYYSRFQSLYDLFIVVFFLFSLNVWWRGQETLNQSTKQCIFGSHISSERCVRPLSPSLLTLSPSPPSLLPLLLRACLVTGSTPLLSATFVLEVRNSGVPRSKGRLAVREGKGRGGGRRTGQRGWELNNG